MSLFKYFNMGFAVAALLLTGSFNSVSAQEEQAVRTASIEEIIVTARKIEESSQKVPVAITAITGQDLARSSIRDLNDINGFAPNVRISEEGSRSGGANINIRGISPTRADDNSFDPPIGIMLDGIYLGSSAGAILENFDLERIEILRGPQGTLFGKNTVGGVINVIRSRPTGEAGARLQLTVGEDGQNEQRAVINLPSSGNLKTKLFMTQMKDDGWLPNKTTGNKIPRKDYSNYGVTFLYENEKFEALLTVEQIMDKSQLNAYHTNYNFAPGVMPAPPAGSYDKTLALGTRNCAEYAYTCRYSADIPGVAEMDTENDAENDIKAFTLNMSYELNENITLRMISGVREQGEYRIYDYDGSAAPFITIERWNDYEQTSHEFRFEGQWERSSLIAGVYLWESEFTQDWVTGGEFWQTLFGGVASSDALWSACQGTNGLDGAFAPISCDLGIEKGFSGRVTQILYETQKTESTAAFAQYTYDVTDKLSLEAGARWTEEKKHFIAGQAYLSNLERARERNFAGYADLNNTWDEVSLHFGAAYEIDENRMFYASFSEGFHSGGFFGVNQNIRDYERDQYDPEFATSIEVGFKSMLMDNRLRLNLTAFHNEFEDKQESYSKIDPDTKTVASVFDNAAEVLYEGWEAEILFAVTPDLRVFLNAGFLDASYEEFETDLNPGDNITIVEDASFLKPRNAPDSTIGVGFNYTTRIGNGELDIFAKYTKIDDFETDVLNLNAGRVTGGNADDLSATIAYYFDNYSISLFGKNLTDEQVEFATLLGGSNVSASLFNVGTVTRPRSIGLEFSAEF